MMRKITAAAVAVVMLATLAGCASMGMHKERAQKFITAARYVVTAVEALEAISPEKIAKARALLDEAERVIVEVPENWGQAKIAAKKHIGAILDDLLAAGRIKPWHFDVLTTILNLW